MASKTSQARHAQCRRTLMTRRSESSRYSSGSRGANMIRRYSGQVWKTERTNVITASAASLSVLRMDATSAADWTGWVTRKNTINAAPEIIRTFLTFTASYSVSHAIRDRRLLNNNCKQLVPHAAREREGSPALGAELSRGKAVWLRCVSVTGAHIPMIRCVGAVVHDSAGRLLLVQRGHEPGLGLWSLPGGRVEPDETDEQAVTRELLEETGLSVRSGALVGRVERPAPAGVYEIFDYACTVVGGALRAGDD